MAINYKEGIYRGPDKLLRLVRGTRYVSSFTSSDLNTLLSNRHRYIQIRRLVHRLDQDTLVLPKAFL